MILMKNENIVAMKEVMECLKKKKEIESYEIIDNCIKICSNYSDVDELKFKIGIIFEEGIDQGLGEKMEIEIQSI